MVTPRIAVDAFGGDACPRHEVEGAILAAREGHSVVLVGDRDALTGLLAAHGGAAGLPIEIHHAPDVITMNDTPAKAVRQKPQASMPVCFDLVKSGSVNAVVSAGNSGAMLACGLFKFGRIKGVERPAIITTLPNERDYVFLVDAGANVDCRPLNLVQWAALGAVYSRVKKDQARPRVGVLSNGEEEGKGTDLTRAAHRLLREHDSDFEYVGYVEGGDMFGGEVDVVVTDGFTGNVALKVAEGAGALLITLLRREADKSTLVKLGAGLMRAGFQSIKRASHPDYYGGAPLLGVRGIAIICHGSSSPRAIATAVGVAAEFVDKGLTEALERAMIANHALFEAGKNVQITDTAGAS